MKTRPGDPCPCGSGKPWRDCCQEMDEAAEQERLDEFFTGFHAATLDGRVEMLTEFFRSEPEVDGEAAFDLMTYIVDDLRAAGRAPAIDGVLDQLARRHPEAYAAERRWFDSWRVENALLSPGTPCLAPLLDLANAPGIEPDALHLLLDALCYHGRTDEVIEATAVLVPRAWDDEDPISAYLDELLDLARAARTGRLLSLDSALLADDPRLREALAGFEPPEDEIIADQLDHLTGRRVTALAPGDLARGRDAWLGSLPRLATEFTGHLLRRGLPHLKATLASDQLLTVLVNHLEPAPTRKPKKGSAPPAARPLLLPPPAISLALVDAAARSPDLPQSHRIAALALALVEWPGFLAAKGLATSDELDTFRRDIAGKTVAIVEAVKASWDPALEREVTSAIA